MILDNAPGHPTTLDTLCENVKVTFLPPNTTSLLQPMDQGIIATFKAYYLRRTFAYAIAQTTGDNAISLIDFWKKYNIKDAIENISHAWEEVTASNMRAVWQHVLPHCANTLDDFPTQVQAVVEEITDIGRQLGFDELDTTNVSDLLKSHSEEMTDGDLLNLDQQRVFEEADTDEEVDNVQIKEFSIKEYEIIFQTLEALKQQVMDADPNIDRSMQVRRDMDKVFTNYKHMYEDFKKKRQFSLAFSIT